MDFLYVVLAVVGMVGILWGIYYFVAFILLWPRLLAKHLSRHASDVALIRKKKTYLLLLQFSVFLLSIISTYLYSPKFFGSILTLSLICGIGFFLFEVFVYYLFPSVLGLILIGPPPRILLREVGDLWIYRVLWIPVISLLLALIVASHVAGLVFFVLGLILAIRFRQYIRRDEDMDKLDYHIKGLQDENQRARIQSVIAMGDTGGDKAVQGLIWLLDHPPYLQEHTQAVKSLGQIRDPRAVIPLLSILSKENHPSFRDDAITTLSKIAEVDAEQIVTALRDENPKMRTAAADALSKGGWMPKNDVEKAYFYAALERWEDVDKLGAIAKDALLLALKCADSQTRKHLLELLQPRLDEIEFLVAQLGIGALRRNAINSLAQIKDNRAVKPLLDLYEEYDVRNDLIEALSNFGVPVIGELVNTIRGATTKDWKIRIFVADILKKIGKPSIEPLLDILLNDPGASQILQSDILDVLGEIGDHGIIKVLSTISPSEDVTNAIRKIESRA